ncbi:hypothetical protein NCC49_004756 [Naganishia albida]|nr:hypothetical protein NCC49_004756 [Naganishia albida]
MPQPTEGVITSLQIMEKLPGPQPALTTPPDPLVGANIDPDAETATPPRALEYTLEQDARVLRKIDLRVLPVLCLTYMLQQMCKSALPWASAFDLLPATNLQGTQYSWLTSLLYIAQLAFQPLSSFVLVRFPIKYWILLNLFGWSAVTTATAAATSFTGLAVASFLLGMFQATIANSCVAITQNWWRRREQSYRTTYWQIANSSAAIIGPLLTYGVGHAARSGGGIKEYQAIFICIGLLGVCSVPLVAYLLPNSPETARFLRSGTDRAIALTRLRENQTGTAGNTSWKWSQFRECLADPKTWGWAFMYLLTALPSGGFGAFGPIITRGFGYSSFQTILMQMPTGVIQIILLWTCTWVTNRIKLRFPVVALVTLLPIAGAIGLLLVPRDQSRSLLACYYIAMTLSVINPLLLSWGNLNAAGHTKRVVTTSISFVFSCIGNIVGPQVYLARERPYYRTGLYVDISCWSCLCLASFVMAGHLKRLNKKQELRRIAAGRVGKMKDLSIMAVKEAAAYREVMRAEGASSEAGLKEQEDRTDMENMDFHYVI